MSEAEIPYLVPDGDNEYTLIDGAISVWITVNNLSVYVRRTEAGVNVEIYALGAEDARLPLSTCAATFEDPDDAYEN